MTRKLTYTDDVAKEICNRLSEGETLQSICRDSTMPRWRTVYDWMKKYTDFSERVTQARQLGFDAIAEQALLIADTPQIGEETETSGDKVKVYRRDMVLHRRLQVDTRLKLLAKWYPSKYGDKTGIDITSGGNRVALSDTERAAKLAGIIAAAEKTKGKDDDRG